MRFRMIVILMLALAVTAGAFAVRRRAEPEATSYGISTATYTAGERAQLKALAEYETQGIWKRIQWQTDLASARAQSKAEGKPLLVFIFIGEHGNTDPARC